MTYGLYQSLLQEPEPPQQHLRNRSKRGKDVGVTLRRNPPQQLKSLDPLIESTGSKIDTQKFQTC